MKSKSIIKWRRRNIGKWLESSLMPMWLLIMTGKHLEAPINMMLFKCIKWGQGSEWLLKNFKRGLMLMSQRNLILKLEEILGKREKDIAGLYFQWICQFYQWSSRILETIKWKITSFKITKNIMVKDILVLNHMVKLLTWMPQQGRVTNRIFSVIKDI